MSTTIREAADGLSAASEAAESPPPSAARALSSTKFGTFQRFRLLSGADVFPRGLPTRGARPVERVPLEEALTRRWDDDRHIVLYTSDRPYRINNAALGKVRAEVQLLALDVDNHDGVDGWMEAEREKIAALVEAHPGAFVHTTRGGWRAFFALPAPFPIASEANKENFALFYARVAAYVFERFGVVVDDALTRWNQPVRLPHVVRDGRVFDAEIVAGDAQALGAFELPEATPAMPDLRPLAAVLPRWGGVAKRWEPKREVFRISSAAFDHVPLPPYADCLAAAEKWVREEAPRAIMGQGGRATARSVAATLHVGFALQREDVARLLVGPYNRRRCAPPWSEDDLEDLRGIALSVAHTPIQTWGFMLSRDRTGIEAAGATLSAQAEARNVMPLDEVGARIVKAIEDHPALVIRATYGAGKTHAVAHYVATETTGRVIVVVARHELARTWVAALLSAGEADVAYHGSVVQRRDAQGRRECDNKLALELYREGGDVARDVCPSCPRAETCPAYHTRPKMSARVHVLPREMLTKFELTDEDLVVLDDAAVDLLAWHRLSIRQLRRIAATDAGMLPEAQATWLPIFVDGLLAKPREADAEVRARLAGLGIEAPAEGEALRFVAERLTEGQRTPRLASEAVAEGGLELDETVRDVGRLRQILRFSAACAAGGAIRWSKSARSVHGESAVAELVRAHSGPLVALDATANLEELRALRPELHVERLDVDDAGDVARVLLFAKDATRTAVRDGKRREVLLTRWLEAALAQLRARAARQVVFVTYKELEDELLGHSAVKAWLAEEPGRKVRVAHYGALRGSNRFSGCDAVVTLGDPWLNGDDVLGRAEWLGLDEPAYRVALATAELGQAHGRSRSVRRAERLTHVHVGRLVPEGWGRGVTVEPLGGPPERTRRTAARIEFGALVGALGGNRAAAAALGCSSSAVAGWKTGSRGLPSDVLERARALVAESRTQNTVSSEEARAGVAHAERMDAPACREFSTGCVHASSNPPGVEVDQGFQPAKDKSADDACRAARHVPHGTTDSSSGLSSEIPSSLEDQSGEDGEHNAPSVTLAKREISALSPLSMTSPSKRASAVGLSEPRLPPPSRSPPVQTARRDHLAASGRVVAALEALSPAAPRAPPGPATSFDAELALLAEALAAARRRAGIGA